MQDYYFMAMAKPQFMIVVTAENMLSAYDIAINNFPGATISALEKPSKNFKGRFFRLEGSQ